MWSWEGRELGDYNQYGPLGDTKSKERMAGRRWLWLLVRGVAGRIAWELTIFFSPQSSVYNGKKVIGVNIGIGQVCERVFCRRQCTRKPCITRPMMNDFNHSRDTDNANKTPNRLSQLFIFGSGYPRFSYALRCLWLLWTGLCQLQSPFASAK